jgi:hypothetical protein
VDMGRFLLPTFEVQITDLRTEAPPSSFEMVSLSMTSHVLLTTHVFWLLSASTVSL